MTTISVKIPESLKLRMESESNRRGLSKSRLIREALERAFATKKAAAGVTVFDLTKDLCGAVTGGPSDLSSNPKHLDGYGA
jgi:hypothetical protein